MNQNSIRFSISISAEEYLDYYRGAVRNIQLMSDDGRNIRFPASALQPFVSSSGIHGTFTITFDSNNKLVGVERIA